jgi:TRAP-type C4-dicarboxylate transport system permease small subunit
MPLFRRFDAALGRAYKLIGDAVGISIGLFALSIALDLVLRSAGLGNLPGLQEIIGYSLFVGVFLAAPWVMRLNAHIRVDVLLSVLPGGLSRWLERFLDLLGFVICLALVRYGIKNWQQAYEFGSTQFNYFEVSEWWLLTAFVICFFLLAIEFLSRLIRGGAPIDAAQSQTGL